MAFYPLASRAELVEGLQKAVAVGGRSLLLVQNEGRVYIIENRCPHMDAPLLYGQVQGERIRCRAHGIAFSLLDGRAEGAMAQVLPCLQRYMPVYRDYQIGVEL